MPDDTSRSARLCRLKAGLIQLGLPGEAADLLSAFVRLEVAGGIEADRRVTDREARRALLPEWADRDSGIGDTPT